MISTMAKIMYYSLRKIMKMTHFVHSFSSTEDLVPTYSYCTVRYTRTVVPSNVKIVDTMS